MTQFVTAPSADEAFGFSLGHHSRAHHNEYESAEAGRTWLNTCIGETYGFVKKAVTALQLG